MKTYDVVDMDKRLIAVGSRMQDCRRHDGSDRSGSGADLEDDG